MNKNVEEEEIVSEKINAEGNEKLKIALKTGDMTNARVAQNMITAGITANEEIKVKKDEARNLLSVKEK